MITACAIPVSTEQASPKPPLFDGYRPAAERGHSVETIRVYGTRRRGSSCSTATSIHATRRTPMSADVLGHLRSRGTVVCRGAGDRHRQEQIRLVHTIRCFGSLRRLAREA